MHRFVPITILLSWGAAADAAVVYNNLVNGLVVWNSGGAAFEAADLVELEGPERTLTGITTRLWITGASPSDPITYSAAYRIYGRDPVTGLPSTVLAEATLLNQQVTSSLNQYVHLEMPNIQLADQVMVGLRYFNVSGGFERRLGVVAAHPPVVGWSDPDFWYLNDPISGWGQFGTGGQGPWGNLAFEIHAVPEPATLALLAGLALLAVRRRRS